MLLRARGSKQVQGKHVCEELRTIRPRRERIQQQLLHLLDGARAAPHALDHTRSAVFSGEALLKHAYESEVSHAKYHDKLQPIELLTSTCSCSSRTKTPCWGLHWKRRSPSNVPSESPTARSSSTPIQAVRRGGTY